MSGTLLGHKTIGTKLINLATHELNLETKEHNEKNFILNIPEESTTDWLGVGAHDYFPALGRQENWFELQYLCSP